MTNRLDSYRPADVRRLLIGAAKQATEAEGYTLTRVPGRSDVWNIEKDGQTQMAAIRTTRDRRIAFPPLEKGAKWKTLDDVGVVILAAVDSEENPENIEVFILPAKDVRERFDAAFAAHTRAGLNIRDNVKMSVALDLDYQPGATGSGIVQRYKRATGGIVQQYKHVAIYSIDALLSATPDASNAAAAEIGIAGDKEGHPAQPTTIADVIAWARERVAEIAGVRVDAVKLDLKVQY